MRGLTYCNGYWPFCNPYYVSSEVEDDPMDPPTYHVKCQPAFEGKVVDLCPIYWRIKEWNVAVSYVGDPPDGVALLIEYEWNGSSWDEVPFPNPPIPTYQPHPTSGEFKIQARSEPYSGPGLANPVEDGYEQTLICPKERYFAGISDGAIDGVNQMILALNFGYPYRIMDSANQGDYYPLESGFALALLAGDGLYPFIDDDTLPPPIIGEKRYYSTGLSSSWTGDPDVGVLPDQFASPTRVNIIIDLPGVTSLAASAYVLPWLLPNGTTFTLTPSKYFTYGGIYDENTGERV